MTARPDIPAVNDALAGRMGDLARALVGAEPTDRRRDEWRFRRKGSLAVLVAGPRAGSWHDHESGAGGDPLGLVAHLRRAPMREAFAWALGWLGEAPHQRPRPLSQQPAPPPQPPREPSRTADLAARLWREAMPADDPASVVPVYLASRGLTLPADAPLRFHPSAWRNREHGLAGPAMVAAMTDPVTGEWCGAHLTYIRPDGGGKAEGERAKIMLGAAGVIRLVPDDEVTLGLGLAEGIETALAVLQRGGWSPVWAATSAGAVHRFPVLPGIEALTVFADADSAGIEAARACCRRWVADRREARILAPAAGDWDDALPRIGRAA